MFLLIYVVTHDCVVSLFCLPLSLLPRKVYRQVPCCILHYPKETCNCELVLGGDPISLIGFSNSDYTDRLEKHHSIDDYPFSQPPRALVSGRLLLNLLAILAASHYPRPLAIACGSAAFSRACGLGTDCVCTVLHVGSTCTIRPQDKRYSVIADSFVFHGH